MALDPALQFELSLRLVVGAALGAVVGLEREIHDHDVAFAASPAFASIIGAAGFEAHPAGPDWQENLSDPVMQKIMAGEFFVDLIRMGMVEGVVRAAKATGAEAIVHGSGELGGLVAGAILELPVASAAPAAAKFYEPMIRPGVARAAAEHGLDGERVTAPDFEILRIDRTPPSLETPGNVPLFRLIADALADQPFDVVMALGHGIPREAHGDVAGNVRVGGCLPQNRVLERASAVVSHGGYNTVSATLGAGLPQFLLPMGADQPYNTERCIATGAALGVIQAQPPGPPTAAPPPFTPPDPAVIRDGTRRPLDEPAFVEAARGIASEIASMPSADYAAECLEEAVLERQAARLDSSSAALRA